MEVTAGEIYGTVLNAVFICLHVRVYCKDGHFSPSQTAYMVSNGITQDVTEPSSSDLDDFDPYSDSVNSLSSRAAAVYWWNVFSPLWNAWSGASDFVLAVMTVERQERGSPAESSDREVNLARFHPHPPPLCLQVSGDEEDRPGGHLPEAAQAPILRRRRRRGRLWRRRRAPAVSAGVDQDVRLLGLQPGGAPAVLLPVRRGKLRIRHR